MASGWTTIRASSSCSPRAVKKYAQRPKNRTKTRTKTHRRRKYATGQAEGEIRTRKAARTSDLPSALESLCRKGSRRSKGIVAAPQNDPEKPGITTPTILSTRTLNVPPALGHSFVDASTNRRFAYVDGTWLSGQLRQLIASLHVDPRALAVFLAPNTAGTISSVDACAGPTCFAFAGYHGALINGNPNFQGTQPPQSVNTYAYAGSSISATPCRAGSTCTCCR